MPYIVKANINGRRIASKVYETKADAENYAKATNKDRRKANARVKKI